MSCVPAPTCKKALAEATELHPQRDRSSDGICASSQHHQQNPSSDHETGEAFDLTHDPAHGVDTYALAERLRQWVVGGIEDRVKYVISNHRIFNPSISPNWRDYHGANPHTEHMHVSVLHSARDDVSSWWQKEEDDMTADEMIKALEAEFKKPQWGAFKPLYLHTTYKAHDGTYRQSGDDLVKKLDADPT